MRPGDLCPHCKHGIIRARSSRPVSNYQRQSLECPHCQHKEIRIVAGELIRRRSRHNSKKALVPNV